MDPFTAVLLDSFTQLISGFDRVFNFRCHPRFCRVGYFTLTYVLFSGGCDKLPEFLLELIDIFGMVLTWDGLFNILLEVFSVRILHPPFEPRFVVDFGHLVFVQQNDRLVVRSKIVDGFPCDFI